jgi:hypothetical protein
MKQITAALLVLAFSSAMFPTVSYEREPHKSINHVPKRRLTQPCGPPMCSGPIAKSAQGSLNDERGLFGGGAPSKKPKKSGSNKKGIPSAVIPSGKDRLQLQPEH